MCPSRHKTYGRSAKAHLARRRAFLWSSAAPPAQAGAARKLRAGSCRCARAAGCVRLSAGCGRSLLACCRRVYRLAAAVYAKRGTMQCMPVVPARQPRFSSSAAQRRMCPSARPLYHLHASRPSRSSALGLQNSVTRMSMRRRRQASGAAQAAAQRRVQRRAREHTRRGRVGGSGAAGRQAAGLAAGLRRVCHPAGELPWLPPSANHGSRRSALRPAGQ